MHKKNKNTCSHCEDSIYIRYKLHEDNLFWIICDYHPLTEGHILIIPKEHISCMGDLGNKSFEHYKNLYKKVKSFIKNTYGPVGVFEHGIVGQTVFHAHTHLLPFDFKTREIIKNKSDLRNINSLDEIKNEFEKNKKYLFLENNDKIYLINTDLAFPRFFRDIFAEVLNVKDRANWKEAKNNIKLEKVLKSDIQNLIDKWYDYYR
ncbi:MAG: HIT domain-containing protein, partial [Parcubacteria group bacterium]|nr:HIT domain-containing protein [Parcubacteria group bacterium]